MQEEVESRSLTLAINTAKLTGRTLKNAIAKLLAYRKNKKAVKAYVHPQGKQSVKKLIGQNQGVSSIELADGSIRDFEHVARKYGVALLLSNEMTSPLMGSMITTLNTELAPRITRHGVLVEVYGEGILITGDSGVGKSETAIELVKRGHRLIADDAVELRRVSSKRIMGSSPENIRHFIELRGIGIINVARLFGIGAVKNSVEVESVIELEPLDRTKNYDRTGLESQTTDILGVQVPNMVIPVMPGRNLAVIIETAAMNNRAKEMGYNAAKELLRQLGLQNDVL